MKKFKFLFALAVIVTMISTFAFANSSVELLINDISYTGSGDLEVSIAFNSALTTIELIETDMVFDSTAWKYKSARLSDGTDITDSGFKHPSDPVVIFSIENEISAVEANKPVIIVTFEPVSAEVNKIGTEFYIDGYAYVTAAECDAEIGFNASIDTPAKVKIVKGADVDKITDADWTWTDATAYKVSTTVNGTATEVNCVLKASYTRNSDSTPFTDKEIFNDNTFTGYFKEGSTISFRPIILNTDKVSNLVVTGTFTLK